MFKKSLPSASQQPRTTAARRRSRRPDVWAAIAFLPLALMLALLPPVASADGTTTLVSLNSEDTAGGKGASSKPVLSADGRFVAFQSFASDLTDDDSDNLSDVFVRDIQAGKTTLLSDGSEWESGGDSHSGGPSISADGRFVAYRSWRGGAFKNVMRDLRTNSTTLVNSGVVNSQYNSNYGKRSLSADGRFVAFSSSDSTLTAYPTNDYEQAYVLDLGCALPSGRF